jgi:hypothetical protein
MDIDTTPAWKEEVVDDCDPDFALAVLKEGYGNFC